jgi:phospholipase D
MLSFKNKRIFIPKYLKGNALIAFLIGIVTGIGYIDFDKGEWQKIENSSNINVCFTPPKGCGELIAREILSR